MLPAQHRLQKDQDFQQVYKGGKSVSTALFRIIFTENQQKNSRFGVVIANKTLKQATDRNNKKRKLKAALAKMAGQVTTGYDIVLVAKPNIASAEYPDIVEQVVNGLIKAKLLRKE